MKIFTKIIQVIFFLVSPFVATCQIGTTAPDFTVTDTHGQAHTLYDYLSAGKVVVLDFYYTTCGPCQYYSPQANLAFEKYGCNTANVIFLSIDYNDSNAEVMAYDAQYQIPYPSVSGLEGGGNEVVNQYNITGFPTFFVIDSSKKIIDDIDPPTLQVFDFRFHNHGIEPADCNSTAVTPIRNDIKVEFFPNPISDHQKGTIQLPLDLKGTSLLEIYNFAGQRIKKNLVHPEDMHPFEFNMDEYPAGNYFLKITPSGMNQNLTAVFTKM